MGWMRNLCHQSRHIRTAYIVIYSLLTVVQIGLEGLLVNNFDLAAGSYLDAHGRLFQDELCSSMSIFGPISVALCKSKSDCWTMRSTAKSQSCHHTRHHDAPNGPPLHDSSRCHSFLTRRTLRWLLVQWLACLGTDLEDSSDLVEQLLVLDRLTALQGFDVVGRDVNFLGKVGLSHLVAFLTAAFSDGGTDVSADFLDRDDVIGAVDFGETLAFDTGFAALSRN